MKAVIFCAGKGTRLRPITFLTPKCLVKIKGKPVIEHIMWHFANWIDTYIINIHHFPMKIMKKYPRCLYLYEPKLLGVENTLFYLQEYLDGDYFVTQNGDTLTDVDISDALNSGGGHFYDGDTYIGTSVYPPNYFHSRKKLKKIQTKAYWQDIGTIEGLKKAIQHENKLSKMS